MKSRSVVFDPVFDKINYFTPMVFIVFAILQICYPNKYSEEQARALYYVVASVFLDFIHVLFTLPLVLFLPELKRIFFENPGLKAGVSKSSVRRKSRSNSFWI